MNNLLLLFKSIFLRIFVISLFFLCFDTSLFAYNFNCDKLALDSKASLKNLLKKFDEHEKK